MIAAVRGILEFSGPDFVLLEVGGVTLRVFVPVSLLNDIGEAGATIKLHTHFYVKEDQMALYGFKTVEQLALFETLLGVSGVGPKAALNVLSRVEVSEVYTAIEQNNVDFLKKIPGIGPKTAARIILDLKGKLVDISATIRSKAIENSNSKNIQDSTETNRRQITEALSNLGYTTGEVQSALKAISEDSNLSLEEQVLEALRFLGR